MTAAYFEDHPTDPNKIILRKPKHDFGEPWSPVSIGVDVTEEGAHVVGIYALDNDTSQIFYSKFYPAPQRKPLTDEEIDELRSGYQSGRIGSFVSLARAIEAAHGIKGEA